LTKKFAQFFETLCTRGDTTRTNCCFQKMRTFQR